MGGVVWRSQLRYYKNDPVYKVYNKKDPLSKLKGESLQKKKAEEVQDVAAKKEATKTFLFLDAVQSSADIASMYLDKHFSPTQIVRTPVMEADSPRRNQS